MPASETGKFASRNFFQLHKDIIHKVLENPDLLMELSPEDLERISKQYPYFSAAQVLLSKSYQRRKDHRFADQVAQASLYAGNREKLYRYLKEESIVIETPIIVTPKPGPKEAVVTLEAAKPIVEPAPSEVKPKQEFSDLVNFILDESGIVTTELDPAFPSAPIDQERAAISFHVDELPVIHPSTAELPEVSAPTIPQPVQKVPEMDDFQREILLEAIQSSIEQEVGTEQDDENETSTESTAPIAPAPAEDDTSFAAWVYRRSQQVHFAENPKNKPVDETTSPDVSDWKHLGEDESQEIPPSIETGSDAEVDALLNRTESPTLSHSSRKIQSTDYETHKRDLIDRFIRQEPRITRGKTTDYTPGNIAKDSVDEDHLPVTETMAQLYARQGRLDKARKAFKKLIELHPEKSVYFAAQLKNLDKFKKP